MHKNRLLFLLSLTLANACVLTAEQVPAHHKQGSMHGFLLLKSADGKVLAMGDQVNIVEGDRVQSRLTFHFIDGSLDDETTVFEQAAEFHLISDHHVQKGPSFPEFLDVSIHVAARSVIWREEKNGKLETHREHLDLPSDLANGMLAEILENVPLRGPETTVSYLGGAKKPRLVKLEVRPDGEDTFRVGEFSRHADRLLIHTEIGGLAGIIAPFVGKQPPDARAWVLDGEAPAFLRLVGPLSLNGPIWDIELTSPVWPGPTQ